MTNQNQKFLIDVVPIARIPLSRQQFFSYVFDRQLPIGTLVSIPLFRRNIEGVVIASRPEFQHTGGFQLKKVYSVVEESFMTKQQLQLAENISNYYLTPLGTVLRHFMPKRVVSRTANIGVRAVNNGSTKNITLTSEQEKAVSIITDDKSPITDQKFLLFGPASSGKTEVYTAAISKLKLQDPSRQFLILLSELTLAPQAVQRYGAIFSADEIVLIHSKISKGQLYQNWQKIKSGQAKIIIGTRMALFAPFQNLGLVVIDEEQDMSFKQWDMNPRYDARKCCLFLQEIYQTRIVFGTATPRIETYFHTESGNITLLRLPILPSSIMGRKKLTPDIEIVDMRKEKWTDWAGKKKPNHSLLSLRLQEEISYALSHKLQTILFVNHQGMSAFSICSSCKTVLRCPKCDRALVYDNSGEYKCLHCNHLSGAFVSCNLCKGIEFKNIGIGTQLVEREIKKMFPQARLKRLDGAASKTPDAKSQVFEDFENGKIDILIGTQMITKGWDNPNVALVAVVDADSLFTTPDFLTDERAFSNIMQVAGRTGRVGAVYPGHVMIQTYNPLNKIFDFVINRNFEGFYQSQISERRALRYPPFGTIIKFSFKDEDKSKTEKITRAFYDKIYPLVSQSENISISEPDDPLVSKIRTKFIRQMIMKIRGEQVSIPVELIKLIASLPTGWSIDVDPISIA